MRVGGVSGEGVRGTGERVGAGEEEDVEARGGERYENGKIMMVLGWLLFAVIVVANSYVLVELMRGKG
jgi:Mn2+/Fe2+ NRAMP family transporter